MAITPLSTPPNSGDPATFNTRADTLLGQLPGLVDEINAVLPYFEGAAWATVGGTANALTLAAGFPALARGMRIAFRASSANTGAATINLDGKGAVACRTVTGVALPAGYIRTDADTVAVYDGTYWVLQRETERGSNSDGDFMRFASGLQLCAAAALGTVDITTAAGALFRTVNGTWNFPAPFVGGSPVVSIIPTDLDSWGTVATGGLTAVTWRAIGTASKTGVVVRGAAQGRWY